MIDDVLFGICVVGSLLVGTAFGGIVASCYFVDYYEDCGKCPLWKKYRVFLGHGEVTPVQKQEASND